LAAGDILKEEGLVIEEFTVKADENIEKGEIVINDGNGILAAVATDKGPYFMALKDHTYASETVHTVRCVVAGHVEVQKKANGATKKGQYAEISATAGEVSLAALTNWYEVVGICLKDAADADTTMQIRLGCYP